MKKAVKIKGAKGFSLVEILVVVGILATLMTFLVPNLINGQRKASLLQAQINAGRVGQSLMAFESDMNSYPSDETAEEIYDMLELSEGDPAIGKLTGNSSNAYFRQLFPGGFASEEKIFIAPKGSKTKGKADDVLTPYGEKLLRPGENGYAYVLINEGEGLSSSSKPKTPVAMAPIDFEDSSKERFNPEAYINQAVILRADGSVYTSTLMNVEGSPVYNKALDESNKNIFAKGEDSVWGEDVPNILLPE